MPFLQSQDGTNLFYNDWGAGKPILLVHGWSINSDSWEYMTGDLCRKGYRCIVYDQRGCGRSEKPWTGYDFGTLCDDLASIIEKLHLSDLTLIGHSMGCGIVCQYLADYGELAIAQAVLIGTTTPYIMRTDDNPDGVDSTIFEAAVESMRSDRPNYVRGLTDGFFNLPAKKNTISSSMVDWALNLTLQASARASEELYRTSFSTDLRLLLTRINIPVLLQHGSKDVSCPLELTAHATQRLLKNSELKIYEELPHGMYITEAAVLCDDIDTFIRQQAEKQPIKTVPGTVHVNFNTSSL